MRFRIIDTYHKPASWNMAFDQVLLELAHKSLPTIRFLSFSPHCALVGNFQSVEQEIRVDYCRSMNIDINRRITGGGAIYFDESQLGWEIIGKIKDFNMGINEMNEFFGNICAEVLKRLGIPANFKQRNDVEVNGRKISGMGGVI
jgi:lipoate-protein ligase A